MAQLTRLVNKTSADITIPFYTEKDDIHVAHVISADGKLVPMERKTTKTVLEDKLVIPASSPRGRTSAFGAAREEHHKGYVVVDSDMLAKLVKDQAYKQLTAAEVIRTEKAAEGEEAGYRHCSAGFDR